MAAEGPVLARAGDAAGPAAAPGRLAPLAPRPARPARAPPLRRQPAVRLPRRPLRLRLRAFPPLPRHGYLPTTKLKIKFTNDIIQSRL